MRIEGPIFATVTPFDSDGKIDKKSLVKYLEFLANAGVSSIVVNGTTGEFPSLKLEEKVEIFKISKDTFPGKIVSHISSCSYQEANELARLTNNADAFLVLPPYYYDQLDRSGLIDFFLKALDGVSSPTYLYNFPHYTKIQLLSEDVISILKTCENVVGIKDSSGNFETSKMFNSISPEFDVFVGGDNVAYDVLSNGLRGSVTGASNPFPEFLVSLNNAWKRGNVQLAKEIQEKFDCWNEFRGTLEGHEISIVKEVISLRIDGFSPVVRSPLITLSDKEKKTIREHLGGLIGLATNLEANINGS